MRKVTGECNSCGLCCKVLAVPAPEDWPAWLWERGYLPDFMEWHTEPEWRHFLETRGAEKVAGGLIKIPLMSGGGPGAWKMDYAGRATLFFRSICPKLSADNKCMLFGSEDRPKVCDTWPGIGDDLTVVKPECSYEIVEVDDDDPEA